MLPDSPEASAKGCRCPAVSGGNNKGEGTMTDGVTVWTVNPECPIHADPKWWTKNRK